MLIFLLFALISAPLPGRAAEHRIIDRVVPHGGPAVELEPGFAYYHDRSPGNVAAELLTHGYRIVDYILTADSSVSTAYIDAFHTAGIAMWYTTFVNGTYSVEDLPADWKSWRMVTRSDLSGTPLNDGYERLCLNNPGYRTWKKRAIVGMMRNFAFDGINLVEPHWPEYPGKECPAYACFCPHCLAALKGMFPGVMKFPDILDDRSPDSPGRNPALWSQWIRFRTDTLTAFLDDLVNGPDGLRTLSRRPMICIWTLALAEAGGYRRVMEDSGEDPAAIAKVVHPDVFCFQTHWPDWTRPELKPDYVRGYRPFLDAVRAVDPAMPLIIQADTGSNRDTRRSWRWIRGFEKACHDLGVDGTTYYEYAIGKYMDTDPPAIVEARWAGSAVRLQFSKRVDAGTAGDPRAYTLTPGRVSGASVDGSSVTLAILGVAPGSRVSLTARGIADDPARRLFHDHPQNILGRQVIAISVP